MSQLNTFGQSETHQDGQPGQPGHPDVLPAGDGSQRSGGDGDGAVSAKAGPPSGVRALKPVHLAALATVGVVAAGGLAWVLLGGGSTDTESPIATTSVVPSAAPSASAQATSSPTSAGVAGGRNPFAGAGGTGGTAAADGVAANGGAVTVTATAVQSVTSTVTVPVVSTVTATKLSTVTNTKTETAQPIYAFVKTRWNGTTGEVYVNSNLVNLTAVPVTTNGVTIKDTDPGDNCLMIKPADSPDTSYTTVCQGQAVTVD